jgi:hypothetical protein
VCFGRFPRPETVARSMGIRSCARDMYLFAFDESCVRKVNYVCKAEACAAPKMSQGSLNVNSGLSSSFLRNRSIKLAERVSIARYA